MKSIIEGKEIIYEGTRNLGVYRYRIDQIGEKEILLKMEYSTICGSDLHTYLGRRSFGGPTMIGHEGVGRIYDLGGRIKTDTFGNAVEIGDLILFLPYLWCNRCEYCARSEFTLCMNRTSVGSFPYKEGKLPRGTFSEYLVLPEGTQFIKIEENGFPVYAFSPVNCAMSTVLRGFEDYTGSVFGKKVLILGAGGLGIYAATIANSMGAREIYVVDKNRDRLSFSEKYGATGTFTSVEEMTQNTKLKSSDGVADVALNLSGYPPLALEAIKLLKRSGKFIEIGTIFSAEMNGLDLANFVVRGVNVTGFRTYEIRHLRDAYEFMVSKKNEYDFTSLVHTRHTLSGLKEAFDEALTGKNIREALKDDYGGELN